jgi:hypothetical protein
VAGVPPALYETQPVRLPPQLILGGLLLPYGLRNSIERRALFAFVGRRREVAAATARATSSISSSI